MPAASATAAPPLLPPGGGARCHGLKGRPRSPLSGCQRRLKAGVLVGPTSTAPARLPVATGRGQWEPPRVRWRSYTLAVISSSHPEDPMTVRRLVAIIAALAALALGGPATAETTLRVVLHSDLKIVDPIWTTAYIVRNH